MGQHDTIVIGGGQSGLAMSYHLRQRNRDHIVLERNRIAYRWHNERWDSLHFQFPNRYINLPGFAYDGSEPDGFAHYREIAAWIERYAALVDPPIRTGVDVIGISRDPGGDFHLDTSDGPFTARRVVVATGPFQQASVPAFAEKLPSHVHQVHASVYRNPNALPLGAVLVVGSGASGCQIADELLAAGREVYLSVSRHRRVPRRYRGQDFFWWLMSLGRLDATINSLPDRQPPASSLITGVNGGYDLDIRRFIAAGGVALGRLTEINGSRLSFDDQAEPLITAADKAFEDFRIAAEQHAIDNQLNLPTDIPAEKPARSAIPIPPVGELDLRQSGISSIVWCTGYRFDYGWLEVPVFDAHGAPLQQRGVTPCPNLYFLGLHWMHTSRSGLLSGVGNDAAFIADHIAQND